MEFYFQKFQKIKIKINRILKKMVQQKLKCLNYYFFYFLKCFQILILFFKYTAYVLSFCNILVT
jgi:hypothetical protein